MGLVTLVQKYIFIDLNDLLYLKCLNQNRERPLRRLSSTIPQSAVCIDQSTPH